MILIIENQSAQFINLTPNGDRGPKGESNYEYAIRVLEYAGTEEEYYTEVNANRVLTEQYKNEAAISEENSKDSELAAKSSENISTENAQQTEDDVLLTHSDVELTREDVLSTHHDVELTNSDKSATNADVITVGNLKNDVTSLKNEATTQAGIATTKAGEAAASATAAANSIASLEYPMIILDDSTLLATGTFPATFKIPSNLNGKTLSSVIASVSTASTSGVPTFQITNVTTGNNMLSTLATIDINELDGYTASVPAVVNPTYKVVSTGDRLVPSCSIAGTGTKGCTIILKFVP